MASECEVVPNAIVVCDVAALGSLAAFEDTDADTVESDLLFRYLPDVEQYADDHADFRTAVRSRVPVIDLADLVDPDVAPSLRTNPNHVFTRDSAITFPSAPDLFLRSRMAKPLRRPETDVMTAALTALGHTCIGEPPPDVILEGGDVIPFEAGGRRIILVGHGPRSTPSAVGFLADLLIPDVADEIVGFPLAPWRRNLDGAFVPIGPTLALVEPSSFDKVTIDDGAGQEVVDFDDYLRALDMTSIEATRDQSIYDQACNAVCLGDAIGYYDLAPNVAAQVRAHGIEPLLVPGREMVKGRGGPRCMTRPIYRDGPEVRAHTLRQDGLRVS